MHNSYPYECHHCIPLISSFHMSYIALDTLWIHGKHIDIHLGFLYTLKSVRESVTHALIKLESITLLLVFTFTFLNSISVKTSIPTLTYQIHTFELRRIPLFNSLTLITSPIFLIHILNSNLCENHPIVFYMKLSFHRYFYYNFWTYK